VKLVERLILSIVAAAVLAGLAIGVVTLLRSRSEKPEGLTQRELAQAAAADPSGPQMSLWRTDPGRTVMLFGKAIKTGAFDMPADKPLTLRALVMERGAGFAADAKGIVHIARKVDGKISNVVEATRVQLEDPKWTDVPLIPADVVYVE